MSERHEHIFYLEGYTDGKRVHKEMFNTYHKGNANENFSERSLHVNQNDVIFFLILWF